MALWQRENKGQTEFASDERLSIPKGVWVKCEACSEILVGADLQANLRVCPHCNHHHSLSTKDRMALLLDSGSFEPIAVGIEPQDPLGFADSQKYRDRLNSSRKKTGLQDAIIAGHATLDGLDVAVGFLAFEFMGGSMGSVVGEVLTRVFELSLQQKWPAIVSSASGGARMQEGILSLMQMAKTSAALGRCRDAGIPYFSLLHHPTTGGVAASFGMLGDINIAEPGALVGFAGPRVIEQTIRQQLPPGFQRAEFLLEHGMVDLIAQRKELKSTIARLIRFLTWRQKRPT